MKKHELLQELWAMERANPTTKISRPDDLLPVLQKYTRRRQEEFVVVTLDGSHKIIKIRSITKGLVDRAMIHPREVFRPAIMDQATAVVLVHNHPTGELEPSNEDDQVTKQLQDAGDLIGIKVLDHLIISKEGYFSYEEDGKHL